TSAGALLRDAGHQRIRRRQSSGSVSDSVRRQLADVLRIAEVRAMAAVVRKTNARAESQVTFEREVPLLNVRVTIVDVSRKAEVLRAWNRKIAGERIRHRQSGLAIRNRVGVGADVARVNRPTCAGQGPQHRFDESTIASAD